MPIRNEAAKPNIIDMEDRPPSYDEIFPSSTNMTIQSWKQIFIATQILIPRPRQNHLKNEILTRISTSVEKSVLLK